MTHALGKSDLIRKKSRVEEDFWGGAKGNAMSFSKPFKIEGRAALGCVTSNLTSKLMDIDTSVALLFPGLDQACFQLTKEHCLHSESTIKLPQASKQSFPHPFCLFFLLLSGYLRMSLSRVLCFSTST